MTLRRFLCLPVDFHEDPRTIDLCATLGDHADAYLVRLWTWAVRQSPDGVVGAYSDAVLATAARWSGDPAVFVGALRSSGWLDGPVLADWSDLYRVEAAKQATRERVNKHRAAKREKTCNVTETEFSLSLNSKRDLIGSRDLSLGGIPKGGDEPRSIPPLCDPWWSTDQGTLRAYLLAIPGPEPLLALPDPEKPHQTMQDALQARFPAWDGLDGRPTLQERAQATWDALRVRVQRYTSDPYRAIVSWRGWIGDRHDQAAQRIRRSTGDHDPALLLSTLARSRTVDS